MLRALFLILLLSVGNPAKAEAPVILIMGDSLSAAYGIDTREGWVALLEERLNENGHAHRVVNSSISGDTTRSGATRLPRALRVHQPTVVIIELGGNDGLRGIPIPEIRGNLVAMIEASLEAGARPMLVSVSIPPNYGQEYRDRFRQVFVDLAASYRLAHVSLAIEEVAEAPGMLQDDGIHPTAAAQPLMLDRVWSGLKTLLNP
jgi:acyl-CoA thioesterase I